MADELLIRCNACGLVFNKLTYPDCPRCRHLRRKTEAVGRTRLADGRTRAVETGAIGSRGLAYAPAAERSSSVFPVVLATLVAFAAGGGATVVALNAAVGRPWLAAPVTVLRVPSPAAPSPAERSSPDPKDESARALPAPIALAAPTHSLELGETTTTLDPRTNTLSYEGIATNVSPIELAAARVTVIALDEAGHQISSGWTTPTPARLPPGAQAHFTVRLRNDPAIARLTVRGEWTQPVAADLGSEPLAVGGAPPEQDGASSARLDVPSAGR